MFSKEGSIQGLSLEEAEQHYRDAHKAFQSIMQRERTALSQEEKKTLADAVDTLIPLYQEASVRVEGHDGYDTIAAD